MYFNSTRAGQKWSCVRSGHESYPFLTHSLSSQQFQMLVPMGLPENVRVIAWGLSLERPTMIKYRIKNIRDLFGHKVEMARTRSAPICRFEAADN